MTDEPITDFPEYLERDQYITLDEREDYTEDTLNNLIGVNINTKSGDGASRATEKKRLKNNDGKPVGSFNSNSLFDTCV